MTLTTLSGERSFASRPVEVAQYLAVEAPRRLVRTALCSLYGVNHWHIASGANKPYVREIIAYLNRRPLETVIEVGCGFCDILSHLCAPRRIGYDADPQVVRAARLYAALKHSPIEIQLWDLIREPLVDVNADAWILVNWLHGFSPREVQPPLHRLFETLRPGGMIVLDTVVGPGYQYHHAPQQLFEGCSYEMTIINQDAAQQRTVFCVTKATAD